MSSKIKQILRKPEFSTIAILAVMIIIVASLQKNFFQQTTIVSNINTFAPLIILSIGQAVVLLADGYDFSCGNAMALVLCVMTKVMDKKRPETGVLAILVGAGIALLIGLLNGFIVGYLRLPSFIATFTTSYVFVGIALLVMPKPGGEIVKWFRGFYNFASVDGMPSWIVAFGKVIPPVLLLIILICVIWIIMTKVKTGRYIYAVGSNYDNAYYKGINSAWVQTKAFLFAAFCDFACALFYAGQNGAGNAQLGSYITLQTAAAAIVGGIAVGGGKGYPLMAIPGAIIMSLVGRIIYHLGISSNYQMLVSGVIIILAIGSSVFYSSLRKSGKKVSIKEKAGVMK